MNATIGQRAGLGVAAVAPLVAIVALFGNGASDAERSMPARASDTQRPATARAAETPSAPETPSAAEFAKGFVGTTNQYAADHGEATRIGQARCVQAAPGRYMCSYAVVTPGAARECHIMQAQWTPDAASTFTITLAGRAKRCGSLREALDSLD